MDKTEIQKKLLEVHDMLKASKLNFIILAAPSDQNGDFLFAACEGSASNLSYLIFKSMATHPAFESVFTTGVKVKQSIDNKTSNN